MNPPIPLNTLRFSTGYISSLGQTYETPTPEQFESCVTGAMEIEGISREQVIQALLDGYAVRWQKSPNYTYDHSYGKIFIKQQPKKAALTKCDCGHSVPKTSVMSASMGTSCPECYDRMSE